MIGPTLFADQPDIDAKLSQPLVGIVDAKLQAEFGPRREHAIGLGNAARDEVVDHHPEIGIGTRENQRVPALDGERRIGPGQKALGRCLLIASGAIDLPGEIQARQGTQHQARGKFARIDVIIFDGIAGTLDHHILKARHRLKKSKLNIGRQRGRNTIGIDRRIVQPLGFEKHQMTVLVGEPNHLVLDRGAIARAARLDAPRIHRRSRKILGDDPMRFGGRAGFKARNLRRGDLAGQRRKGLRRRISMLFGQHRKIDGCGIEPGRRTGLEASQLQPKRFETHGQAEHRLFPRPSGRDGFLAAMDQPAQERTRGQHHRPGADPPPIEHHNAGDHSIGNDEIVDLALDDFEIGRSGELCLHRLAIKLAIFLRPGPTHRRPLASVEDAELNPPLIGDTAHDAIERIDLTHQMAFAQSPDRRVAAHLADGRKLVRDQRRRYTQTRRSGRRFRAGMAAANNDHTEIAHAILKEVSRESSKNSTSTFHVNQHHQP